MLVSKKAMWANEAGQCGHPLGDTAPPVNIRKSSNDNQSDEDTEEYDVEEEALLTKTTSDSKNSEVSLTVFNEFFSQSV